MNTPRLLALVGFLTLSLSALPHAAALEAESELDAIRNCSHAYDTLCYGKVCKGYEGQCDTRYCLVYDNNDHCYEMISP